MQNKRVLSLDLAAIMAGSGIRGQFEEKFKGLIRDIEDEVGPDRLRRRSNIKVPHIFRAAMSFVL